MSLTSGQLHSVVLALVLCYVSLGLYIRAELQCRQLRNELRAMRTAKSLDDTKDTDYWNRNRKCMGNDYATNTIHGFLYHWLQFLKIVPFKNPRKNTLDYRPEILHSDNHTAIPSASQEVEQDGQGETNHTANTKTEGEDSTQSRTDE